MEVCLVQCILGKNLFLVTNVQTTAKDATVVHLTEIIQDPNSMKMTSVASNDSDYADNIVDENDEICTENIEPIYDTA